MENKIIRRICHVCSKSYMTSNSYNCPECQIYVTWMESKRTIYKKPEPNSLTFLLNKTTITELIEETGDGLLNGYFRTDKEHNWSIKINLMNFNYLLPDEDEMIRQICKCISHEILHLSVWLNEFDSSLSKSMDKKLMDDLKDYL